MDIINRIGKYKTGEWYQRSPKDVKIITVHHSAIPLKNYADDDKLLDYIRSIHEGQGWPGLAYHFVITKTGNIYQINNFEDVTWHDTKNYDSIGVLVNGYFHKDINDKPTKEQLKSLDWLLDRLCFNTPEIPAGAENVLGHRERSATACPGDNLFPYVVEYRTKKGAVEWSEPVDVPQSTENGSASQELERLRDIEKKYFDTLDVLSGVRDSRDQWKNKYEDLEELYSKEILSKNDQIKVLDSSVKTLNEQVSISRSQIEKLRSEMTQDKEKYEGLISSLKKDKEVSEGIVESLEANEIQLREKIAKLEQKVSELDKKVKKGILEYSRLQLLLEFLKFRR